MDRFKRWNNIAGWSVFLIAATVYLLTLEPTVSFWDCGEFIACAHKLEVGHPPGAPLFLMLAKVFSLLASNPAKVAVMINTMSALASAFTILFLFWTITHLAKKVICKTEEISLGQITTVMGAGLVGALAFTFSDSFWFSAVEAEVYATSALFTAVVFWAILKWESNADTPFANRWIILIAYLMGLSIGVHLLNLLTIPAIALVIYFRKWKPSITGFLMTIFLSFIILASIQYGIIPGIIKLAVKTELLFVNSYHLPYHSGIITYVALLCVGLSGGLWLTYKRKANTLHTVLLSITMIIMGYGSYAMIVVRSNANPPLNENRPDNMFSLLYYLNREQYGAAPIFYGPYYNAPTADLVNGDPTYTKANGRYVAVDSAQNYTYDSRFMTFFPRMYSRNKSHIEVYKEWGNIKGTPMTVQRDGKQYVDYRPTFSENLAFFFKYQVGYMYFRYLMWNFSGRQNGIDGDCGILHGNWITGFNIIDSRFLGPQDKLPSTLRENKGRNKYYMLPFILGILGMVYLFSQTKRDFSVVFFLFFMTGIAIVIYLNQTPLQPRERDYAYVGSFYSFAIWIGFGVLFLIKILQKWLSQIRAAIVASTISFIAVPALMASQNWDDHNRSGRYTAHDVAYNYLNSCAPNAILFTDGDNDTFPLWFLQEVEGIRTDVRVVNTVLLSSDWYIDQLKQKVYNAAPIPISLSGDKYLSRRRDFVYLIPKTEDYIPVKEAVAFAASDDPKNKTFPGLDFSLDYMPSKNFILPVDTLEVVKNGTVKKGVEVLPEIPITFSQGYISKSEFLVLDILSQNNWKRPIYFGSAYSEAILGLRDYLQLDGITYRLVPIQTKSTDKFSHGRLESSQLYDNLMNKFRWGRMNQRGVLIDDYNINTFAVLRTRVNFSRLAQQLYEEGKKDSATQVLNRVIELMPGKIFPHDVYSLTLIETAYKINAIKQAQQIVQEYADQRMEEIRFYYAMSNWQFDLIRTDNILAQQTIQNLADLAGKFGDKNLKVKLEIAVKKAVNQN